MDETADTMQVTIRVRALEAPWGVGLTNPVTREVTIATDCPRCGEKRGEPTGLNQYDDGAHYWVQVWRNPCGHLDRYAAVWDESQRLAAPA